MRRLAIASKELQVCSCALVLTLVLGSYAVAQNGTSQAQNAAGPNSLSKYPGLLPELGRLIDRLQHNVTFPPDRTNSRLLPLLPSSTTMYFAAPNYGGVARQSWTIFQQELNDSADLRAWWADSGMAANGLKIDELIDKFSTVSDYLGDETVVSAVLDGREPDVLIISEVRKPGLKSALQQFVVALASQSKSIAPAGAPAPNMRILDPQDLATASNPNPPQLLVLLRPDFVIASSSVARLRSFNSDLDRRAREFSNTPFGQRVLQSYTGGVSWVGAVNVQKLLEQAPKDRSYATMQQTGFADMKYAIWQHRDANGRGISRSELSFTRPRHGVAAWLAAPQQLGSLDFVSPKAILATSLVLKNPALIFDDIRQMSASNPNALASVTRMEQAMGISLQNDVLAQLSGELTIELNSIAPQPAWKVVLGVKDPERLQQTLGMILTRSGMPMNDYSQGGVVYHTLRVPSGQTVNTFAYGFIEHYLVVASNLDALSEAVRMHNNGESLSKSRRFLDSAPGRQTAASALLYEDPAAMMALQMQRFSPAQAQSMTQLMGKSNPVVMAAYGDPDAIRGASSSPGADAGIVMVAAAIAIPNLIRARTAANEASAVGKLRTVNTAQVTYARAFPQLGFAPDLASLGPPPGNSGKTSSAHFGLLDSTLAAPGCTGTNWCTSSGYRFMVKPVCGMGRCINFVAVATPDASSTGMRNFCSTADGVIRYQIGTPLSGPPALAECKSWAPIH